MKVDRKKVLILCADEDITQVQLAERCNISPCTLSTMLNGRSTTIKSINKIAKYFKVDISMLIQE
ncbi:helix-turn-helix domain-containing protein [Peptoanaerobacter stomatis]